MCAKLLQLCPILCDPVDGSPPGSSVHGFSWQEYWSALPFPSPRLGVVSKVTQSCLTLCDPMDCSLPGSSVHGIFQARVLEWAAISFSRGSSQPRDQTRVSSIADRRFTIWATKGLNYRSSKCIFNSGYFQLMMGLSEHNPIISWGRSLLWLAGVGWCPQFLPHGTSNKFCIQIHLLGIQSPCFRVTCFSGVLQMDFCYWYTPRVNNNWLSCKIRDLWNILYVVSGSRFFTKEIMLRCRMSL